MNGPRQMRRHARRMRRYGMQPMVVINSGDPLPDLVIVLLARWLWRYRSELAPGHVAGTTALAAWTLHATHPSWWAAILTATVAGTPVLVIFGSRLGLSTVAERWYAATVTMVGGGWLAAASALGPWREPLPRLLVAGGLVLAV